MRKYKMFSQSILNKHIREFENNNITKQCLIKSIKQDIISLLDETEILFSDDTRILLKVKSFEDSFNIAHGEVTWCLTREEEWWNHYKKLGLTPYFLFDFSNLKTHQNVFGDEVAEFEAIGVLVDNSNHIVMCRNRVNRNVDIIEIAKFANVISKIGMGYEICFKLFEK